MGHVLSADGIRPNPDKILALQQIASPTDVKSLQSFLGLANWFRRFIKDFAAISDPLTKLLHKDATWNWTEECEAAFIQLKQSLTSPPLIIFPDPTKPYVLVVDASNRQIGAALLQQVDQQLQPVYYLSRTLDVHETKYSVSEKECLALVWAIKQLRRYLYGTRFIVRTDHRCLVWLVKHKDQTSKLMRWILALQEYDFVIIYGTGTSNVLADALSRLQRHENLPANACYEALEQPVCIQDIPEPVTTMMCFPTITFRNRTQTLTNGPRDENWIGRSVQFTVIILGGNMHAKIML